MGRISARVFSMNFLRSLLEKGHQVSPQGKRRDQIWRHSASVKLHPEGQQLALPHRPLLSAQKTLEALQTLPPEPYACFVRPQQSSVGGRWVGIGVGGESPRGICTGTGSCFLYDGLGGAVSQMAAPSAWEAGQGTPEPPVHPLAAQAGGVAHPWEPDTFTSAALLISVSPVLPVLSQGGGQQDTASLVMISLALLCGLVWVFCFSHHPWSTAAVWRGKLSLQHWLGTLRSAVHVSRLLSLVPEIPFPTDAFHARTWICFFVIVIFKPLLPQVWITWSAFLSSRLST